MTIENGLLTTSQVADLIGIDAATVRSWARAGKLSAIRLSRRTVRFASDDVETLLRRSRTGDERMAATA